MKIFKTTIARIVKSLFSTAITVKSQFSSEIVKKAWQVYRSAKAYYLSIEKWTKSMRYELFSDSLKIAKRLLEFETAGIVMFKKVGSGEFQQRNILIGGLDFEPIRGLVYRFIDKDILEENGGDINASIRSFRLSHIA